MTNDEKASHEEELDEIEQNLLAAVEGHVRPEMVAVDLVNLVAIVREILKETPTYN